MFPWWMRLFIFLPLAALQIVLLTISALGWQYEVGFQHFMILLGDMVSSALQLNLIEAVIRDVLASWDIVLPELGKHWHHVFVLTSLFSMATVRLGQGKQDYLFPLIVFPAAALCSLLPALATGAMPTGSLAVVLWPLAGFFLLIGLIDLFMTLRLIDWEDPTPLWDPNENNPFAWRRSPPVPQPPQPLRSLVFAAAFAAAGYFLSNTNAGSGMLIGMAIFIIIWGAIYLLAGLVFTKGTLKQRLQYNETASGLDIVGPFAVAATLAWLFGRYIPI